jgi:uncharacterized membrane protein YphA (DoxX/SURF4 family)
MSIPGEVIWSASVGGLVFSIGLVRIVMRGELREARGVDKLIVFGPVFFAAPLAAFGTEHFTLTAAIASLVPSWMPWHEFWAYFIGACFIAAGVSMVTGILTRLSAGLVALTFFVFVAAMDAPAWAHAPSSRIGLTLALRELSFCGGALALAATPPSRSVIANRLATVARFFVAIPVLVFSFEQFLHGDHVAGVPLEALTPSYVVGGAVWTYLAAVVYAVAGVLLVVGRHRRAAATWLGLAVLVVVVAVYVPMEVVHPTSLDNGFNYLADTLMFCGAVLLLAGAMPREADARA